MCASSPQRVVADLPARQRGSCSSSIDPARISDTQITPDFYAIDAAKRLRRSRDRRASVPVAHTETFAGQSATCVDVPVPGGASVFCVLPNGRWPELDDGAVSINSHGAVTTTGGRRLPVFADDH